MKQREQKHKSGINAEHHKLSSRGTEMRHLIISSELKLFYWRLFCCRTYYFNSTISTCEIFVVVKYRTSSSKILLPHTDLAIIHNVLSPLLDVIQ